MACAHDCRDISYTSVVFGNDLHASDVSHFLPGKLLGKAATD